MKKMLISLAMVAMSTASLSAAVPAVAQYGATPVAVCQANSPSAVGQGYAYNMNAACQRALYECAVRTPAYQTCYVTKRYWTT